MTVVAIDDTDSRTRGMCTTYLAARVADRLAETWPVERRLLVRLNPAVAHKTRGNAALAIHTDAPVEAALDAVRADLDLAETADPRTNPGVVVAPGDPGAVPDRVVAFARRAVRDHHDLADARDLLADLGYETLSGGNGRGLIGALAAVGAWRANDDWTYECISYRERERRGTPRDVDRASVFAAAEAAYPDAWDTVDRGEDELVCVPHTPGPILHGIRGDDPAVVREVAETIESEPIERRAVFVTNQGTDAHLRAGTIGTIRDGRSYRVTGRVLDAPETREGGHVFLAIAADGGERDAGATASANGATTSADGATTSADGATTSADGATTSADGATTSADGATTSADGATTSADGATTSADGATTSADGATTSDDGATTSANGATTSVDGATTLLCAAFEPTKRFRDRVRALRVGDRVTVCGEVSDGTLKLEKFAVRDLVRTERVTPTCPDCGRSMESAGRDQGYRCRDCGTSAARRAERPLDRELEIGWYEVPPCARRHIAKPLVRGGFDAATHPER